MYFANASEFFAMGGHGFYVWLAVGFSLFWLAWLVIAPQRRHAQLLREIAQAERANAARRAAPGG